MTDEQKAEVAKNKAISELKRKTNLTQGFAEFVIKIDMNLDAPIVNTGCVMPVTDSDGITRLWAVINMEEFGSFIDADGLATIQSALTQNNRKSAEKIAKVCPTAVCAPFLQAISLEMLKQNQTGTIIMAIHLMDAYLKNPHNRLRGQDINYCHFASRCHIYFNNYPAGLKAGTTISMAGNKFTPHLIPILDPKNKVYLYDLIPKRRELKLLTGDRKQFIARTEAFTFPEDHYIRLSEMTATVTQFLAIYETQHRQLVDAVRAMESKAETKKSTSKKEVTPKKTAKKAK